MLNPKDKLPFYADIYCVDIIGDNDPEECEISSERCVWILAKNKEAIDKFFDGFEVKTDRYNTILKDSSVVQTCHTVEDAYLAGIDLIIDDNGNILASNYPEQTKQELFNKWRKL